eukprot:930104-Prorocentrum_minimum.AAC.1
MAATLSTPRSLFTTRVARASPATSSAIISSGTDACARERPPRPSVLPFTSASERVEHEKPAQTVAKKGRWRL